MAAMARLRITPEFTKLIFTVANQNAHRLDII
jgi:hypothetical protein